jgi:haloalkane dehalogenase
MAQPHRAAAVRIRHPDPAHRGREAQRVRLRHRELLLTPAPFPFAAREFETPEGTLRYVDEGAGDPVVLVHGTPSWSFEWRAIVPEVARTHRVLAWDALGFGRSDKPPDGAYAPCDHARRLGLWLDAVAPGEAVHLVVHDFGGPFGLGWAVDRPERVRSVAALNTFAWGPSVMRRLTAFGWLFDSPPGRCLYVGGNASPRWVAPSAWADRRRLTPEIQARYLEPFPTPRDREAVYACATSMWRERAWFDALWPRVRALPGKKALIWGVDDPALGRDCLALFREAWPEAVATEIAGAGHFPQEEAAGMVVEALLAHLRPRED